MKKILATALVALTTTTACSSSYMPAKSPRAQLVMQSGRQAIVRDGQVYEIGAFGGGLEEAVAGNPDAEEHARDYQRDLVMGFACSMLAIGAIIAGGTLMAVDASNHPNEVSAPGLGLLLGGIALEIGGSAFYAGAQPHFYDAINVYNDGLNRGVVRQSSGDAGYSK